MFIKTGKLEQENTFIKAVRKSSKYSLYSSSADYSQEKWNS